MPREKLSEQDRAEIRLLRALGVTQVDLARQFGVTERSIRIVLNGAPARKPAPRRLKAAWMPAVRARFMPQLADELDRVREVLEGVDALIGADRSTAARGALGAAMVTLADLARDLELVAAQTAPVRGHGVGLPPD